MFDKLLIALISPLGGGIVLFLGALLLGWQKRSRWAGFLGWTALADGLVTKSATSEAEAMRQFAQDLGVPSRAMLLEERSRNTRQNAQFTAEILKAKGVSRILLVTSALHMRRAVSLFESQGLTVIPAATDHEARSHFTAIDWLPDTNALDGSARAMKEMVGRLSGR